MKVAVTESMTPITGFTFTLLFSVFHWAWRYANIRYFTVQYSVAICRKIGQKSN